jgi:hypothetical protein
MAHGTQRGVLSYTANGVENAREWFTITIYDNGHRTFRAVVDYSDSGILRDVTHSVDERWQPLDCYVRQTRRGAFEGALWMRFSESEAEAEGYTAEAGRFTQRFATTPRTSILMNHSLLSDYRQFAPYDFAGPRRQQIPGRLATAVHPVGDSSPILYRATDLEGIQPIAAFDCVGERDVTVPAGTFRCKHMHSVRRVGKPVEFFTVPGDFIPVLCVADFVGQRYELIEWHG